MIHLAVINWVPTGLIEIGLLLQLIAVLAYLSGRRIFGHFSRPGHGNHPEEENQEKESMERFVPSGKKTPKEISQEAVRAALKKTARTSRVNFVQTFKFRE